MTLEDENSQLTLWVNSCILCFAGPLAKGCRRAQPDEIPEAAEDSPPTPSLPVHKHGRVGSFQADFVATGP